MLTPMYALLLTIEDRGQISADDQILKKAQFRGGLGKLRALRLAETAGKGSTFNYQLTKRGESFIDQRLASLRAHHSSQNWRLIVVDLPAQKRIERNALRYELTKRGFLHIGASVWVSNADNEAFILEKARQLKSEKYVAVFVGVPIAIGDQTGNALFGPYLQRLNREYKQLISVGKKILQSAKNRLECKKVIFQIALLIRQDPQLKDAKNSGRDRAIALAAELRGKLKTL